MREVRLARFSGWTAVAGPGREKGQVPRGRARRATGKAAKHVDAYLGRPLHKDHTRAREGDVQHGERGGSRRERRKTRHTGE